MAQPRNDARYILKRDQLKRAARKKNLCCWICGKPFDFSLYWKHPMSFTADHVDPVANGGSMTGELRPAHRSCNSRRSNNVEYKPLKPVTTSRDWYGNS